MWWFQIWFALSSVNAMVTGAMGPYTEMECRVVREQFAIVMHDHGVGFGYGLCVKGMPKIDRFPEYRIVPPPR